MRKWIIASLALLCACTSQSHYNIAIIGDLPYIRTDSQRAVFMPRYHRLLAKLDSATVMMVVHLGDYTTGPFCGDSVMNLRYAEFSRSKHPFVFIPGDNEWTDCARGNYDPLERLEKLRETFTRGSTTLGRTTYPLTRQSEQPQFAKFRENVRWTISSELYVGINVTGSHNNWGKEALPSAEYVERNAANLAWLRESFAIATRDNKRGIAIFIQANPGIDHRPEEREPHELKGFVEFNDELVRLAVAFGKPVLLVHGDSHYFRVDKPFDDPATGLVIANLTRLEGFAHPNYHWIRLLVDRTDPHVFRIIPEIVPEHR